MTELDPQSSAHPPANVAPGGEGRRVYRAIKRLLDIAGSLTAIILLSPLLLLTAFLIKVQDGGPVFYVQTRVGKNGRRFPFYKFRSMGTDADARRQKLKEQLDRQPEQAGIPFLDVAAAKQQEKKRKKKSAAGLKTLTPEEAREEAKQRRVSPSGRFKMKQDPRITPVGRWIRRFSIDEMPQLINVLKGDMSLVGPRPPLPEEVEEIYGPYEYMRLSVEQGITCLWQVMGRSDIPFEEQVELDLEYIRRRGVWMDIKLLFLTIPAVLSGKGAY